ncbi:ATP-binding protein (plasmid) [Aneurinibacillus sp. Ricciae_BoGa-3]|uniref:ATP-binding protein n=1 Tax=Aneurinibacillus sp. Ricciae_BoGa-3 TaxID=3022697 RepID=UPI002340FB8D|nr:ATP-binding protein [Aneurinibacillus sp. Ricciae_BoGa-3]WCK57699.1 ATP-binding protein [Aneurinibacillus sp. Ricciae_BoGa-3]
MSEIYVVGRTNEKEVYVASLNRPFIVDEYLIIEDDTHQNPIGEITQTSCYNNIREDTFPVETGIWNSLREVFHFNNVKFQPVYIGKMKMLDEWQTPMITQAKVSIPDYEDIEHLLIGQRPEKGFVLGVIRGTEALYEKIPDVFKGVAPLIQDGKVIEQKGIPYILDHYAFQKYPHIGLLGGTGSGKSVGLRILAEEAMKKGIPGLALDPHYELTFETAMDGLPETFQENFTKKHEIFQVGENVGINITELSSDEIITLLLFISDVTQPMRAALEQLHERNDSFTTLIDRINKLKSAFEIMEKREHDREQLAEDVALLFAKHKDKVAGTSTLQGLSWRLEKLKKTGIFEADISLVEACMLKRRLAVIRGKQKQLNMIASYLIGKVYGKRRAYKDWEQKSNGVGKEPAKFPPFMLFLDEAHNYAPSGDYSTPTKSLLREISQEGRKYGTYEVFATQRPALLDTTIVAQLNTKIIFRTQNIVDIQAIARETNLNEQQMTRLPDLNSGNAFISTPSSRKTMYIRFRASKTASPHSSNAFDELDGYDANGKLKSILIKYLPLGDNTIPKVHSAINKEMGKVMTVKEIQEALEEMAGQGEIKKENSPFGIRYENL